MKHLDNIVEILRYVTNDTQTDRVFSILNDSIRTIVERQITLRDVDNFAAYFKMLLSSSHMKGKLVFGRKLVKAFVDRTYSGFSDPLQDIRTEHLYSYINQTLQNGQEINADDITKLEENCRGDKEPTLERLQERIRAGLILKWLRGPLANELTEELQHYIVFMANNYGQSQTGLILSVDWPPYELSEWDRALITKAYKAFEASLVHAMVEVEKAKRKVRVIDDCRKEFRVVFDSLEKLNELSKKGEGDSIKSFKDKIIVATALMYLQSAFVKKDEELRNLIQLLVSLYYQFRDTHYTASSK